MSERNPPPFNIRRLTDPDNIPVGSRPSPSPAPPGPSGPRPSAPAPVAPAPSHPPQAPRPPEPEPPAFVTGGRFTSASATLALLSSVAGARLTDEAGLRRGPRGEWWVELPLPLDTAAPLVWTAGGQPFGLNDGLWTPAAGAGDGAIVRGARESLNASTWTSVGIAELIAEATLQPSQYRGATALNVIVPGSLSRWVLHRASMLSLAITVAAARRLPLVGRGTAAGALLFRIQAPRGTIASTLVRSLCNLPQTIVAPPSGLDPDNLMIDVRSRSPFPLGVLGPMIPARERWVLGPPDVGHCKLIVEGEEIDGATLLDSPSTVVMSVAPAPAASLPRPVPVSLVPHMTRRGVDAVLLDNAQLGWLTSFLVGRPLSESIFVIPGDGVHLLLSAGGLPSNLPFGILLSRIGEAGLYVELGRAFRPPLPEGAQQKAFDLDDKSVVAVTDRGAYRFVIDRLVPVWTMWIGAAPAVRSELSPHARRALSNVPYEITRAAREVVGRLLHERVKESPSQRSKGTDAPTLLERAARAQAAGRLLEAAELLEKAGEPGRAGRLYELVARRLR